MNISKEKVVNEMLSVQEVAREITEGFVTEREKAVALHDYVRDHIKFGFNRYFDASSPEYTLKCRLGHCNPKSRLMLALFRASGLEAKQHFVVIPKVILKGAVPFAGYVVIPAQVSHSYVDVKIEGIWHTIDSYIIDTDYLKMAQARLQKENRNSGYGVRIDSTNIWDGRSDAFSQFDKMSLIEDHNDIEDLDAYFHSNRYKQKVLGIQFNKMFRLMGNWGEAFLNSQITSLRKSTIL